MRIIRSIKSLCLLLFVFAPTAHAEGQFAPVVFEHLSWFRFGSSSPVDVVVNDNVTNGCWTTAKVSETGVKLELKRSSFLLADTSEGLPIQLMLSASGYELDNNSCVVSIDLSVSGLIVETIGPDDLAIHAGMYSEIWSNGALMSGPKSDMSQRVKNKFIEIAQQLILDIDKRKAEFEKRLSQIEGFSQEEVDRRMSFIHLSTQPN